MSIVAWVREPMVSEWPNFKIREYLVPLSGVDVCMGLGLGISGGKVRIEDNNLGLVSNLFEGSDITVCGIVDKLKDRNMNRKKT